MGAAKEARDRALFRQQARNAIESTRLVPVDRYYLQRIEDDLAAARVALAQSQRALNRCQTRLKERSATLTVERQQWAEERERWTLRAHGAERAMLAFRRRWEYVSQILRRLPVGAVRTVRADYDAELAAEGDEG